MGDNFTGREHDSDVLENEDQVEAVIKNLNTIATSHLQAAYNEVEKAVQDLNNVKGMAEYVGTVQISEVAQLFIGENGISKSIDALATAMRDSANSIKQYDEAAWHEKAGSTILMSLCKVGEGLLSIIEDLGDGVFSVVGFVTNDWFGTGAMSDIIKAEWSHDVFNGYYKGEKAKLSAFTEDSGLANTIKTGSATVGYLALSAVSAGAFSGLGAASAFASTTTLANTAIAGISGLGSGTESGLREGKGFYQSFFENGLTQGGVQAGIAFAAGKAGEHMAKAKAVKAAKGEVAAAKSVAENADDAFSQAIKDKAAASTRLSNANKALDKEFTTIADKTTALAEKNAAKVAYNKANQTWLQAGMDKSKAFNALSDAETKLSSTQAAKAASFQGYSDKITQKFYDKGFKAGSNWKELGFVQGTKANASGLAKDVTGVVKTAAKTAVAPVVHPIQTSKAVAKAVVQTVQHPVQTTKAVASAVNPVTTSASIPGLVGATTNNVVRTVTTQAPSTSTYNVPSASTTDKINSINAASDVQNRISGNFTGGGSTPSGNTPTDSGNISNGNTNSTPSSGNYSSSPGSSSTGGSSSPGSSSTGGSSSPGSSSTGGSSSPGSSSSSSQPSNSTPKTDTTQLKQSDSVKDVPKTETPTEQQPSTDTQLSQPQQESPVTATYEPQPSDGGDYTTYHTGGGYSGDGYYSSTEGFDAPTDIDTSSLNPLDETLLDNTTSIDEIVKGSKYTKIPSSSKPITTTTSTGSGSSAVIPIAAGLSAAAAAGIGAKAYMDRKKNNDVDDEDDDFETEEWSGDEEEGIKYDESSDTQDLDMDDDYSYQATESEEKYGAKSSDELADLQ